MQSELGAVILAGGRSARLPDKCFRKLGSKELILHVFEKVSQVTSEITIVVRDTSTAIRLREILPPARVVLDEIQSQSPMVGVLSGLRATRTEYAFMSACDTPFIEPKVIRVLFEAALGTDGAIPSNGELEPLCSVYRRSSTINAAQFCLQNGQFSMLELISRLRTLVKVQKVRLRRVDPQLLTFVNINTSNDLERAETLIRNL
ncbi:MAG TPA: molybdenum cofactor guanylyltransferase [Candidatus Acidoferrum sp.]|nr:molybdenum cofactor guanylyltransferase [Candidatus Acidoferrum sp.]